MLEANGLRVIETVMTEVRQRFNDWVRRSGVPAAEAAALREEFLGASSAARDAFRIRPEDDDLAFSWDEIVILGVKP